MAQMGRPGLSVQQKAELWARWKAGQSISDIGRSLGKHAGSVFGVLSAKGGIAPPARARSRLALSLQDREEISRGLVAGLSLRKIAGQLGRSPSTISREVSRNHGTWEYRAAHADECAWRRASRPKSCVLATNRSLRMAVAEKLEDNWSPQQISGWLKVEYPNDRAMRVSHETIYKSLFIQARGVLKKELISRLRTRRLMRRGKASTTHGQPRGQIVGAISIRERPAEVEDRALPGHWEGDLLAGGKNTHIATLVERQSRFVMLVRVEGKDTDSVVSALVRQVKHLPTGLMSSLTWDRGTELADHMRLLRRRGCRASYRRFRGGAPERRSSLDQYSLPPYAITHGPHDCTKTQAAGARAPDQGTDRGGRARARIRAWLRRCPDARRLVARRDQRSHRRTDGGSHPPSRRRPCP